MNDTSSSAANRTCASISVASSISIGFSKLIRQLERIHQKQAVELTICLRWHLCFGCIAIPWCLSILNLANAVLFDNYKVVAEALRWMKTRAGYVFVEVVGDMSGKPKN